jgi:hypothetical protein
MRAGPPTGNGLAATGELKRAVAEPGQQASEPPVGTAVGTDAADAVDPRGKGSVLPAEGLCLATSHLVLLEHQNLLASLGQGRGSPQSPDA